MERPGAGVRQREVARAERRRISLGKVLLFTSALHAGLWELAVAHKPEPPGRGSPPVERREIYHRSPRLDLVTQDGTPLSLRDLKGKVVLVTFFYSTCPDVCPLLTAKFAVIQRRLKEKGLDRAVHLLSITVDPEIDTPPVLKEYARKYGANFASWAFLTGSRSALEQTWNDFGVVAVRGSKGDIDHTAMTILLDPQGRQRLQYIGFGWLEEDVIRDIEVLVQEIGR